MTGKATVADVTRVLQDVLLDLERNCVAPSITTQVFSELFHFSATHSFNKLLLRRELCQWERAMGIKYNIAQLSQGAHNLGLGEAMGHSFDLVSQVLALLLLNKGVVNEDPGIIVDACPGLNSQQVKQALSLFTPGEFETPVDPDVIASVKMPRDGEPGAPATLLLDATVTRGLRPFDPEVEDKEYECLIATPLSDEVVKKVQSVLGDVARFVPTIDGAGSGTATPALATAPASAADTSVDAAAAAAAAAAAGEAEKADSGAKPEDTNAEAEAVAEAEEGQGEEAPAAAEGE